jgi:hypothetical protein
MSRKEFLLAIGFGILSMMGLATAIQALTGKSIVPESLTSNQAANDGYGSTPYGR